MAGPPTFQAPWHYRCEEGDTVPTGRRFVQLDDIAFTQRQVNDSFSYNRRPLMELVEGLLEHQKLHEIPLIRVAWHQGKFWSIDNRRLFCFKHCQLGRVPVQVCRWEDSHEFEMKWKNGRDVRVDAHGGHLAGVVQRLTNVPFPRSPVMDMKESEVSYFMDPAAQQWHDERRARLAQRRREEMDFEERLAAQVGVPWGYEAKLPDGWFPATVVRAHADGTFDCHLSCRERLFTYPQLRPHDLRVSQAPAVPQALALPADSSPSTFIVVPGMHADLTSPKGAYCGLCQRIVGSQRWDLKEHERQEHRPDNFRCRTCDKVFVGSSDLRRHSRKKAHEIPDVFLWCPDGSENEGAVPGAATSTTASNAAEPPSPPSPRPARADVTSANDGSSKRHRRRPTNSMQEVQEETFVVPKGSPSGFPPSSIVRCALCAESLADGKLLLEHERRRHVPGDFCCCTCRHEVKCSQDLRRHSRSTGHAIPARFRVDREDGGAAGSTPVGARDHRAGSPPGAAAAAAAPAAPWSAPEAGELPWKPHRAVEPWDPTAYGEEYLGLRLGDVLLVQPGRELEGWGFGLSQRQERTGWFPLTWVEPLTGAM